MLINNKPHYIKAEAKSKANIKSKFKFFIYILIFLLALISSAYVGLRYLYYGCAWQRVAYVDPSYLTKTEMLQRLFSLPRRTLDDKNTKQYLKQHKVFVSLTTIPSRLDKLELVLSSLDLTHVEAVLLALPKVFKRTGETYIVPGHLFKSFPKLKILPVEEDLGPITKIAPALNYAHKLDPEAIVISIDDDALYPIGMVNELIFQVLKSQAVVTGGGLLLEEHKHALFGLLAARKDNEFYQTSAIKNYLDYNWYFRSPGLKKTDIVGGVAAVAYKVDLINLDLLAEVIAATKSNYDCFASDDLVLSYVVLSSGSALANLFNRFFSINLMMMLPYSKDADALHMIRDNRDKYHNCSVLLQNFKKNQNS